MEDWPPLLKIFFAIGAALAGAVTLLMASKNKTGDQSQTELASLHAEIATITQLRAELTALRAEMATRRSIEIVELRSDLEKTCESIRVSLQGEMRQLEHRSQERHEELSESFHGLKEDIAVLKDREQRPTRR